MKLSTLRGKKVLILAHAGADVDAFASAANLSLFLGKNSVIGIPDHINLNAKALAENTNTRFEINPDVSKSDALIIVDLNSYEMLGTLKNSVMNYNKPIYVFDHHEESDKTMTFSKGSIINPKAASTTEIIYDLFKKQKITLTKEMCVFIAAGLITDTAHFLVADSKVFLIMYEMLKKSNKSFYEIVSLFQLKVDPALKIAKLKAAKRVRIYKISDYIVVTSDIGAYESDAAMALVKLGADIAFAGDCEKGKVKISGRANNKFIKETGFDLAKHIFIPLGSKFKGEGGGHPGASAFNGCADTLEDAFSECLSLTTKFMQTKNTSASIKEYD
ncbi:MAG: DHH family phosphoesterase [Candidatus Diapherotrites archaeon]